MTISSTTSRWSYVGNGTVGPFAYTTKIFANTDLKVYVSGTLKTLTTHYTVTVGDSGNVTFTAGNEPAIGAEVVIVKDVPNTQSSSLPLGGAFPSTTVEAMADRLTIMVQQVVTRVGRVLRQPDSDTTDIGEIPAKASRLGKYLRFNATSGDPEVVAIADIGSVVVSDTTPQAVGTAAAGTSAEVSRADHVHNYNVSATQRVVGRNTPGAGNAEEVTLTQLLDWIGSAARGDILVRGASSWSRKAVGTLGQVFRSDGTDPQWASRICFRAHKNATDQTLTSATTTDITFGTEDFDVGGYYDTSTNRFTPPAGKYRLTVAMQYLSGLVDQQQARAQINKNGAVEAMTFIAASSTGGQSVLVTAIVDANGTDYFTVVGRGEGAGDKIVSGQRYHTWFCGEEI